MTSVGVVPILETNLVYSRGNGGGSRKVVTALPVFVVHHVSSGVLGPKVQGSRHPFSSLSVCPPVPLSRSKYLSVSSDLLDQSVEYLYQTRTLSTLLSLLFSLYCCHPPYPYHSLHSIYLGQLSLESVHFSFSVEIDTLEHSRVKATSVSVRLRIYL